MPKKIKITLPKRNVCAIAELHEDLAPKTCKAVWNCLPFESVATHAMMSGREIWTSLPPSKALREVPPENQTIFLIPGDIIYSYIPAAVEELRMDIYDFGIAYGRDVIPLTTCGITPVNVFASITENLKEFAAACEKLLFEGREKIIIEKVE